MENHYENFEAKYYKVYFGWQAKGSMPSVCREGVDNVFDIPTDIDTIDVALHTRPGVNRVEFKVQAYPGNDLLGPWEEIYVTDLESGHREDVYLSNESSPLFKILKNRKKVYIELSYERTTPN